MKLFKNWRMFSAFLLFLGAYPLVHGVVDAGGLVLAFFFCWQSHLYWSKYVNNHCMEEWEF